MKKINTMDIKKELVKIGKVNVVSLNTLTLKFNDKKYCIELDYNNNSIIINEEKSIISYYLFIDSEYKKSLYNFFKEVA